MYVKIKARETHLLCIVYLYKIFNFTI
jgi:hypothetical protein